tara:strand:- start:22 stop:1104 length:1083 start_codon:yes stop_codon:yes gene_type:complete
MAYISFQPIDFFNTLNYVGTGSSQAITGVGFQPDFVWCKQKDGGNSHMLADAARGVNSKLSSNDTAGQNTGSTFLTAFGADGFTGGGDYEINGNTANYVNWNWKGGTTSIPSGGSITPSAANYSATSGFGAYVYTGTGSAGTIAHGLGKTPTAIIIKRYDSSGNSWAVYNVGFDTGGTAAADYVMALNDSNAKSDDATYFNDTVPTSTLFSVGSANGVNGSGYTYVAYVFTSTAGFSKCGLYQGNGNADGTFVYTGFEPAFLIAKNRDSGGPASYGWTMMSNTFGMGGATSSNPAYNDLTQNAYADQAVAVGSSPVCDFLSNGFKWRGTSVDSNQAAPFIYMAFARQSIVSSNSKAGTAR